MCSKKIINITVRRIGAPRRLGRHFQENHCRPLFYTKNSPAASPYGRSLKSFIFYNTTTHYYYLNNKTQKPKWSGGDRAETKRGVGGGERDILMFLLELDEALFNHM